MTTWICPACKGVAHPSSGCQYSPSMVVCGPCTRSFWAWFKVHQAKGYRVGPRGSKTYVKFYDYVGTFVH